MAHKNPPPKPRKDPPADVHERARALAADGWSVRGIAQHLGVSFDTWLRWTSEDAALVEAVAQGREAERHVLHNKLFRMATEGDDKQAMIAAMFLLKARHGYREGEQGEAANRVAITFNLPGAQPLETFAIENGTADDPTQRLPDAVTRTA